MSKVQWEYDLVERPFCEQLKAMGWQWIEGDKDVPEFTERANFREVLLKGRLAAALRKLNLRHGQRCVVPACPLRQPYMVFLFDGSSALTSGFLPTEPRDSAVASV